MKLRVVGLLLTILLLASTTIGVFAATGTGTVIITGGSLSVTADDVDLSGATLGTDTTATSDSTSNTWSAADARGSGAGWNLTIIATNFVSGGHTIDIGTAGSNFKIQLTEPNIILESGNTKPTSNVTSLTPIPNDVALSFVSAGLDEGMGVYTLNPNFELEIPANTYAGTYTSTLTITAVTGP